MRGPVRWLLIEAVRIGLILALFIWVQGQVTDARFEALHVTGGIAQLQGSQGGRLRNLESTQELTRETVDRSISELAACRSRVESQGERLESERATFTRLVDSRHGELRAMLESGIDRIEGAAFNSTRETEDVRDKIKDLESSIRRQPLEMKRHMIYPVVQLRGNGTVGSGVVVYSQPTGENGATETYILTAYHVVLEIMDGAAGSDEIDDLRFIDLETDQLAEEATEARLIAFQRDIDIALLTVERESPWPYTAAIATAEMLSDVQMFDPIYAVGCPLGTKPMPTAGEISSQDKVVEGQNFWMISAPTFFGNSGGGVYLVGNGHLIGISSMIYTYGKGQQPLVVPHMGLFIPMAAVWDWLKEKGPEGTAAKIFPGLLTSAAAVVPAGGQLPPTE